MSLQRSNVGPEGLANPARLPKPEGWHRLACFFLAVGWLVDWRFAALLTVNLVVHEYGHALALSWLGYRVKQIQFGFLGGFVEAPEEIKSQTHLTVYVVGGPVFGLLFATFVASCASAFELPALLEAAYWVAFVELMQLLPVHPLDGGQIMIAAIDKLSARCQIVVACACLAVSMAVVGFVFSWFAAIAVLFVGGRIIVQALRHL